MNQQANLSDVNNLDVLLHTRAVGTDEALELIQTSKAALEAGNDLSDLAVALESSALRRMNEVK